MLNWACVRNLASASARPGRSKRSPSRSHWSATITRTASSAAPGRIVRARIRQQRALVLGQLRRTRTDRRTCLVRRNGLHGYAERLHECVDERLKIGRFARRRIPHGMRRRASRRSAPGRRCETASRPGEPAVRGDASSVHRRHTGQPDRHRRSVHRYPNEFSVWKARCRVRHCARRPVPFSCRCKPRVDFPRKKVDRVVLEHVFGTEGHPKVALSRSDSACTPSESAISANGSSRSINASLPRPINWASARPISDSTSLAGTSSARVRSLAWRQGRRARAGLPCRSSPGAGSPRPRPSPSAARRPAARGPRFRSAFASTRCRGRRNHNGGQPVADDERGGIANHRRAQHRGFDLRQFDALAVDLPVVHAPHAVARPSASTRQMSPVR